MARVSLRSRKSPRADSEDLPSGAITISITKNRKYPLVYPEKIEPFKQFSILVKGTVINTNPLYQLEFVHAAKDYARMEIQGNYFSVSIGSMKTKVTGDSRKVRRPLNLPTKHVRREWSIIFHVDGEINKIECRFDGQEVLKEEKFKFSDFRIWEQFNEGVQVDEMLVTSGIPNAEDTDRTDPTPFVIAFVRMVVGDSAKIFGELKYDAEIRVLSTTVEASLPRCPAGKVMITVKRNSHGCSFSARECGRTVHVSEHHLVLHFDAFVPLFTPNFVIRNVTVESL